MDNQPIELLACKLTDDGLRLDGKPFSLLRDDERQGMEGQHWFKKDGYYYIIYSVRGCCGPQSDYAVSVARSKKLEGPYEKYLGNPILHGSRRFSPSVTERLRLHRTDACITYATLTSREAASTKVANLTCKR